MQSYEIIMKEHNLIIQMIKEINRAIESVDKKQYIDPCFVDTSVDFIRFYTDRTHHGKEEDILFRELRKKKLSNEDFLLMDQLIKEHHFFRVTSNDLLEANNNYRKGNNSSNEVITLLKKFVKYYPEHVKKETNVFFPATENYLSEEEDQAIIVEFCKYDKTMIHEKYKTMVKEVEAKNNLIEF